MWAHEASHPETLKYYIAFKRIKNFACVEIHPKSEQILVFVKADFDDPNLLDRIDRDDALRDVREVGHYGTGNLEIRLKSDDDLKRTQDLIAESYERS